MPETRRPALPLLSPCAALVAALLAAPTAAQDPGTVLSHTKISDTAGGFTGELDNSDTFGSGLAALGDLDGNGTLDLAVGADHDDDRDPQAGAVWVLKLLPNGSVLANIKISDTQGNFLGELEPNDLFGTSAVALGDLDGDGVVDLAVGARADDNGAPQACAVWILFLAPDGSVKSHAKISATQGNFGVGLTSDDEFGTSVAAIGDIDGDGVPDMAVGAPRDDQVASQGGAIWTVRLKADGTVKGSQKVTTGVGGFTSALTSNAAFGTSLAGLGDLDGDGTTEIAVGSPGSFGSKGAVWILSVDAAGFVVGQALIASGLGGFSAPLTAGEDFGAGLGALGDLDGDGVGDLAVGQPGHDSGSSDTGAVWLLFLTGTGGVKDAALIAPGSNGFTGTLDGGDAFGASVAALAPAAPGATLKLAVGTTRDDDGGPNHGAVWLLTLQGPAEVPEPDLPLPFDDVGGTADGIPGRPGLIVNELPGEGPGDELTEEPLTVTPKADSDKLRSSAAMDGNVGDTNFAQPNTWNTGSKPIQAATADTDGDGTDDVLTANQGGNSFSTLSGTTGGSFFGDSGIVTGFEPQVEYPLPVDGKPVSLATGDLDGDTDPDVVVAGDQGLTVFLNDGLFSNQFVFASFTPVPFLTDVITGHVDGDGVLDVLAASGAVAASPASQQGFVTVLLGAGDGTLQPVGTFASGRAVASVLLGDVDHAGGLDALVASHSVADGPGGQPQGRLDVYLGDGAGGFSPSAAPWSLQGAPIGAGYAVPHPDGIHPRFGALADMDSDGFVDAVYTSADNIAFEPGTFGSEQPPVILTVLLNDGLGGFDVNPLGTAFVGRGTTPLLYDFFDLPGIDEGDAPDCILVYHQDVFAGLSGGGTGAGEFTFLAAFVGDGSGLLIESSPNQFLAGQVPGDPAVADLDPLAVADGAPDGLDIVVPDLKANAVSLLFGDGAGGVAETRVIEDVDDLDPSTLPAGGVWVGGPRRVATVRLFGDDLLDIVAYNRWDDQAGLFDSVASVSIYVGDGLGNFVRSQYLPLPGPGEFALLELDGDAKADLVVTVRGVGADAALVYRGTGMGTVATTPDPIAIPTGFVLTGGLEARDVDGDVDGDLVTTARGPSGDGHVLLWRNVAGTLVAETSDLGVSWAEVRSVDVADLTGDALRDVAIGTRAGKLHLARALPGGGFASQATNPSAGKVGGGALRITDLNGDPDFDLVASSTVADGTLDQASVRALLGAGGATFAVKTMPGVSSVGIDGALRPAVGDLNGDGATDVVLAHGTAGTISILLNKLSTFATYEAGKAGSGGIAPTLTGLGYTTPGGKVDVSITGGLGGAPGLLQLGVGQAPGPLLAVQNVLLEVLIQLGGTPGVAGAGSWTLAGHMPNESALVGLTVTMQGLLLDPGAAAPAQGFSLTNGLQLTIVQ